MARSLIGGLVASGYPASSIYVSDLNRDQLGSLRDDFQIHMAETNQAIIDTADVIVLAVKPQAMKQLITDLQPENISHKLLVTIAAGIRTTAIANWLQCDCAIVRAIDRRAHV